MELIKLIRKHIYQALHLGDYLNSLRFLQKRYEWIHKRFPYTWLDDKYFLEYYFLKKIGYRLNLQNPKTFNEKIQWVKLYDRNPLYVNLADKLLVRDFVAQRAGSNYLTSLIGVYDAPEEIDWDILPASYVIKPNHGAGWVFIKESNQSIDKDSLIDQLNSWISTNFYQFYREWQYKNIKPKILVEQLINANSVFGLIEYKIFCFSGKPTIIQLNLNRFTDLSLQFYDVEWERLPISLEHYTYSTKDVPKPTNLDELLTVAKQLSAGLRFCRVDLYNEDGKIYFGELTLTPNAGVKKIEPFEFDLELGKLINLNKFR